MNNNRGKLIFVGLGIKAISHVTIETQSWIENSDLVIHHAIDPLTESWINGLNPNNFSLNHLYIPNQSRVTTYKNMIETIIEHVDEGKTVCVALYGNPGFYVYATHKAAKIAREKGHYVEINPGVSSLDCLLADLDIDIVNNGLQILEATSLLLGQKKIDTTSFLIIMQPGPVGEKDFKKGVVNFDYFNQLKVLLITEYGEEHDIYIYNAAIYSVVKPTIKICQLKNLENNFDIYLATFCLPPK